jgi:hypothetical protein
MTQLTKGFFTDHSVTLTGVTQALLPADPQRQFVLFANPDAVNAVTLRMNSATGSAIRIRAPASPIVAVVFDAGVASNAFFVNGNNGGGFTCWTYP